MYFKKWIALILSIAMVTTMMPAAVFAEGETVAGAGVSATADAQQIKSGATVAVKTVFGNQIPDFNSVGVKVTMDNSMSLEKVYVGGQELSAEGTNSYNGLDFVASVSNLSLDQKTIVYIAVTKKEKGILDNLNGSISIDLVGVNEGGGKIIADVDVEVMFLDAEGAPITVADSGENLQIKVVSVNLYEGIKRVEQQILALPEVIGIEDRALVEDAKQEFDYALSRGAEPSDFSYRILFDAELELERLGYGERKLSYDNLIAEYEGLVASAAESADYLDLNDWIIKAEAAKENVAAEDYTVRAGDPNYDAWVLDKATFDGRIATADGKLVERKADYAVVNEKVVEISRLPAFADVNLDNYHESRSVVQSCYNGYESLADSRKSLVPEEEANTIKSLYKLINDFETMKPIADRISALPGVDAITLADGVEIESIITEMNGLNNGEYLVMPIAFFTLLEDAKGQMLTLENWSFEAIAKYDNGNNLLGLADQNIGTDEGQVSAAVWNQLDSEINGFKTFIDAIESYDEGTIKGRIQTMEGEIITYLSGMITEANASSRLLIEAIATAEEKNIEAQFKLEVGKYPVEMREKLTLLIANAKSSLALEGVDARMLRFARYALEDYMLVLEDHVYTELDIKIDLLENTIAEAQGFLEGATLGYGLGQFPVESIIAFRHALMDAQMTDLNSLEAVNQGVSSLVEARAVFEAEEVTEIELLNDEVEQLFRDVELGLLRRTVTLEKLEALLVRVNETNDGSVIARLGEVLNNGIRIFNSPYEIAIYAEDSGVGVMKAGSIIQLNGKVYNEIGVELEGKTITWSLDDETVATIDETGTIHALKEGNVQVTAAIEGSEISEAIGFDVFDIPSLLVIGANEGEVTNRKVEIIAMRQGEEIVIAYGETEIARGESQVVATFDEEGEYAVTITSSEGDNEETETLNFTIDRTAPEVSFENLALAGQKHFLVYDALVTDENIDENGKLFYAEQYDEDGLLVDLYEVQPGLLLTEPGRYIFTALAFDKAGNMGSAEMEYKILVDKTKPVITITGFDRVNNNESVLPVITLSGGSEADNYTYRAFLLKPDGTVDKFTSANPISEAVVAEGTYRLSVIAENPNSPNTKAYRSVEFIIDVSAPTLEIKGIEAGKAYNRDMKPYVEVNDNISYGSELRSRLEVVLKKDGQVAPYEYGQTIKVEGNYVLSAKISDIAGHEVSAEKAFSIDKEAPTLTISGVVNEGRYQENKTMTLSVEEPVTLYMNGTKQADFTSRQFELAAEEGESKDYYYKIKIVDKAGNSTKVEFSATVDKQPVTFNVTGIKEGAIIRDYEAIGCQVTDGAVQKKPHSESLMKKDAEGQYTLAFDGSDGKLEKKYTYTKGSQTYSKVLHFILDRTAPEVATLSPLKVNGNVVAQNIAVKLGDKVALEVEASDSVSGIEKVEYSIGAAQGFVELMLNPETGKYEGIWTVGSGNFQREQLKVFVYDNGGNEKVIKYGGLVTIDNIKPRVTLSTSPGKMPSGSNGYYNNANLAVALSGESGAKKFYTVDGGAEQTYTASFSPSQGTHNIKYYSVDQGGNVSETHSFELKYDSVKPAIPELTSGKTKSINPEITVKGTIGGETSTGTKVVVKRGSDAIATTSLDDKGAFVFEKIYLAEGTNNFSLYGIDEAGNVGAELAYSVVRDSVDPIVSIKKLTNAQYLVSSSEAAKDNKITATFNGTTVAQENIVKIDGKNQFKVNVTPIEGSNKLEVSVEDSAGNTGAGAHGSNYIPPGISRKGLKVTGNTNIDIPADAFEGTALLTVQTVDVNGQIDMKPLASPIAFTFSEKPKKPIVVSTFIGMGQKGVGMIHIDDNGTVGAFKKAVDQSPINEATMTADLPYYDSKLGVVKLKTADFSAYQVAKDNVSPVITVSTADFEINSSEVPKISGTLTDDDSNAKITEVYVDGNKVEGFIAQGKAFDINVSLTDGNHDVMIKAVDTAGNASTVTKAYKVDKTAPTVTVDYSAKTSESNIAIQMNLNEMAEMFIDGTSVGIFEGSREIDVPLKDGSNKIALKAIDGFGNITTKEIEILKEAPSLSLTVDGIGATTGSTVTVTGTVSNRCNLTVLVNGQAVRTVNDQGAGRYTVSGVGIALNGNTILVKASDLHGNSVEGSIGVQRNSDNPVVVPPNPDGGGIVVPPNPGGGGAVFIPPFIPGMMLPVVEVPKEAKPLNVEAAKTEAKPVVTAGGELDFLDKAVKLVIEKGTFEEESEITVTEIKEIEGAKIRAFKYVDGTEVKLEKKESNTHLKVAGKVYEFDADKETFAKPIEVEFSYDGDSYTEGYKLAVYYYNKEKEQWEHVGGTVDPIAYKIKVKLNHFSTYAVMEYTKTFEDIQAHWAKSDIEEMASQYIAKGTGDKFLPNNNITRAEFATLIVRAFGISADDSADRFKDVSESDWYYETVNAAASAGIVQGFEGTFSPKKNISREEMTIMLMNAYNYEFNKDYKSIYNGKAIAFNDAETISSWSRSAVLGALDLKLVNGSGDNMFNPKNNATRAEAIVVLKRLMGTK